MEDKELENKDKEPKGDLSENQQETKPADEEREEQIDRSRLGRKVKGIESELSSLSSTQAEMLTRMNELLDKMSVAPKDEYEEEDKPLTREEAKKVAAEAYESRKKDEADAQKKYEGAYVKFALKLNAQENDSDLAMDILKEMETNYNVRYSNDPDADAERNYMKAETAVLRKKAKAGSKAPNPLDKNKGKENLPMGVAGADKDKSITTLKVELDPIAKEYAEKWGLDIDSINSALETGAFSGNKFESKGKLEK